MALALPFSANVALLGVLGVVILVLLLRIAVLFAREVCCAHKPGAADNGEAAAAAAAAAKQEEADFEALGDDEIDGIIADLQSLTSEVAALEAKMKSDMAAAGRDFDGWMAQQGLVPADESGAAQRLATLLEIRARRRAERDGGDGGVDSQAEGAKPASELRQRASAAGGGGGNPTAKAAAKAASKAAAKPPAAGKPPAPAAAATVSAAAAAPLPQPAAVVADPAVVAAFESSGFTEKWRRYREQRGLKAAYAER
jgi:hypothetical protein